jgi:hypothetical protein
MNKIEKILNKSLEVENDFSSSSHAVSTLVYETSENVNEEFIIPSRYYRNTLTLLTINTKEYYVYWEFTQDTLDSYDLDLKTQTLYFKVEDMLSNVLFEFESPFDLGEYFLTLNCEDQDICVKVGFMKNNQFVEMMKSNIVHTFSSTIKLPDLLNEQWLEKHKDYIKIIQTTLENVVFSESSLSYMKQLERLHYLNNAIEKRTSSTSLLGKHND